MFILVIYVVVESGSLILLSTLTVGERGDYHTTYEAFKRNGLSESSLLLVVVLFGRISFRAKSCPTLQDLRLHDHF